MVSLGSGLIKNALGACCKLSLHLEKILAGREDGDKRKSRESSGDGMRVANGLRGSFIEEISDASGF
jgi:hypothetical protein